jgi:hypothetical protein
MSRGMEWIIGAILALIIAIVGFHYTKKTHCNYRSTIIPFLRYL